MRSSDSHRTDVSTITLAPEQAENQSTGTWVELSAGDTPPWHHAEPEADTDPASATDPSISLAGDNPDTRYVQHYELIRELGRGGMGVVHLARDLRLGRLVAIKMLTSPGRVRERFLAEARATARCRHENIVVIHEVGMHGDQPYLVFEYLRGQTLRQWMDARLSGAFDVHEPSGSSPRTRAPLTPTRAAEIMVAVVRGLVCAHDMGIIHRDLKPANILLTEEGVTKVLDFGVAKIGVELEGVSLDMGGTAGKPLALTALGDRLGTLPYMSPEQFVGDVVDHRSDIWAVGIILYELVTGAHPLAPLTLVKLHLIADIDTPMPSVRERRSDLGPLADVISRCLLKDREHRTATARELLQELEALLPVQRTRARDQESNPFAGLAAFQEADADRFFGRDRDIDHIVTELRSQPLVAVVGPSGAGKSSLIRAGVIPALKHSGEGWDACVLRPGRSPLAALAGLLAQMPDTAHVATSDSEPQPALSDGVSGPLLAPIIERLRVEPGYLGVRLRARASNRLRRIILFVDQFEELYTLGIAPDERAAFFACLAAVADDAASPLRVIVSMRSDYLGRLAEDRHLRAEVTRGLVLLPPMGREGLREALIRPVASCEFRFEPPALVDRMIDALAAAPGALPLLQFTAARLWELRDTGRRLLTEASYERLGGVAGALAMHADAVLAGMSFAQQALARTVLEHLVTPERTRALGSVAELRALHRDTGAVDEVIQHLAAMRLLVIERGTEDADHAVELVHESLIDGWPTLARWLAENQDDAAFLARLRSAAQEWERRDQDEGLLWRGAPAREAQLWHAHYRGVLPRREQDYLDSVFASIDRAARVRRRIVAGLMALMALLLVGTTVGLIQIRQAQQEADRQAEIARAQADERERARHDAEQARQEAAQQARVARAQADAAARAQKAAEAERNRAEQETQRAGSALIRARQSEAEARRSEARARQAETEARGSLESARVAVEAERRMRQELQDFIDRALGHVTTSLPETGP